MSLQNQVDVSNNSWGYIDPFSDDFSSASLMVDYASIRYAVETGRGGLGTNFVFSAGNSRSEGDNVNHHNFQNARETITVAAIDPDDTVSGFSTPGAAILVGAYGNDIMTTDRLGGVGVPGDYNAGFNGTSAAAPQVSAIIALMLEANPNLGYRDVQSILAHSTRHPDSASWKQNSASDHNLGGHYFNDDMGFGIVDGFAAVRLAETWQSAQTAQNEQYAGARKFDINTMITDGDEESGLSYQFEINSSLLVEHAELGVDIRHERLGDLTIELISPTGTVSRLLDRPTATEGRPYGLFGEYAPLPKHLIFDLTSAQFRGEEASGTWTVRVKDVRAEVTGTLHSLSLRLYGEENTGDDQYIFTAEFASAVNAPALRDDGGIDWINAATVSTNSTVNLATKSFIIADRHGAIEEWVEIENVATGDGDDNLVGSDATNTLIAGRGDDNITPGYGNNVVDGGQGFDTVTFTGKYEDYEISYNSTTKKLSVVHSRNNSGNLQTDTHILTNVELLKFDDLNVSLETQIGNSAPQVSKAILDGPITVENNSDFSILVPEDAFSDADQTDGFELSAELASGVSLPEWMSFDPATGKLVGVPPEGVQGRYTVLVKARDDFGAETFQELTINIGDNLAPVVDAEKLIELDEDTSSVALNITAPTDPEGSSITITVTEVPIGGEIKKGSGEIVAVNDTLSTDEIRDLVFIPTENFVGNAGALSYKVVDAEGVSANTEINILLKAVNDAPEFQINNFIPIQYEGIEKTINLNVPIPTDQEETITEITVVEVPAYGEVKLNGNLVKVGDKIATSSLNSIEYTIDQYINGTVGKFTIRATDSEGAQADWNVKLQVNGEAGLVSGSSGSDELFGSLDSDRIFGLSGDDTISSNDGNDTVYGGSGADIIFAGNGNDIINGGSGDDYISGDVGADTMFGGPGDDTFVVDNAQDKPTEVLSRGAGGKDTIQSYITFSTQQNIENITALGGDSINLSGNSLDNIIEGNIGDNILSGLEGSDILIALAGDDTLDGGKGRDQMSGGKGDDLYIVDSRSDVLYEQADEGFDTVSSSATFVLGANIEKLILTGTSNIAAGGNSLDNVIIGNAGNNYINGGLGADDMQGGDGDDIYVVDNAKDTILDATGNDTVRASIDYTLPGEIENLELIGLLDLEAYGNSSDNHITGNSGNNVINGFSGNDVLFGKGGEDAFYINKEDAGVDVIKDFKSGEDLILIDAIGFDLFDTQSLTGYSGQVLFSDFEFIDTASDRGSALFSLNKETSTLSVFSATENQDLAVVSFDMTLSDEILASDIYILL